MEPQEIAIQGTRVWIAKLSTSEKNIADLKAVALDENFKARQQGAIGSVYKGVAGIEGCAVLVKHEDDDGHGRFNGTVGIYYAHELEPLTHRLQQR